MFRILLALALSCALHADVSFFLRGKVLMADGSIPPAAVAVERVCSGGKPRRQASTDRKGQYVWRVGSARLAADHDFATDVLGGGPSPASSYIPDPSCMLRARLNGYESNVIRLAGLDWIRNPELPELKLYRSGEAPVFDLTGVHVPAAVTAQWNRAVTAMQAGNWAEAQRRLRAVVNVAPNFTAGWTALALAAHNLKDTASERDAYQRAAAADPRALEPQIALLRLEMAERQWQSAAAVADKLLANDRDHARPDIYSDRAVICFHLKDQAGALAYAADAVRLDRHDAHPRGHYVFGVLLEAKGDLSGAGEQLRRFIELDPRAPDAAAVRARIGNLGKNPSDIEAALDTFDRTLPASGEAAVPGGFEAFAKIARLPATPSYGNFYSEYCRAIVRERSYVNGIVLPRYSESLLAYMDTIEELTRVGQSTGNRVEVSVTPANAANLLPLLGWKAVRQNGTLSVEPGDRPADALRQAIPAALGIDEIALRDALYAGDQFRFSFPVEKARLLGGAAWTTLMGTSPALPGGIAAAFARDTRMAKVYLGLSAMGQEAAAAAVQGIGLRDLVTLHADLLNRYADAFQRDHRRSASTPSTGGFEVPGGPEAEPAWSAVAGAAPRDSGAFLRNIFARDRGALAAFFYTLATADAAHQHFFTRTSSRLLHYYAWYRDSGEVNNGVERQSDNWRPDFFRNLPLAGSGHVRFPGGKRAWTSSTAADDEALAAVEHLEALVPVSQIEERRGHPLDSGAASLLALHYSEWGSLFPYFERLRDLGQTHFEALATFASRAAALRLPQRNAVMGEWHSVVKLLVMATDAGRLSPADAARAFRQACVELTGADHSARALAILQSIAGEGDLNQMMPARLLGLTGERWNAFGRIKELQKIPPLESPDTLTALSGLVYASMLDPADLLVAVDPGLVRRHRFVKDAGGHPAPIFFPTELVPDTSGPGSYFAGGFMTFPHSVPELPFPRLGKAPAADGPSSNGSDSHPAATSGEDPVPATETVFQASGRLVEVYASVTDERGRYVDDLPADAFAISDGGTPVAPVHFEPLAAGVSVTLLFDTTASMFSALPALKNAALSLIRELRPVDSAAVYSFSDSVSLLQPFTSEKESVERAVIRLHASGATALYDALVRVNYDLASRPGKKVIVVFTDGADNLSVVTSQIASRAAMSAGIPVYTIAEGEALRDSALLRQLTNLSKATGGLAFAVSGPGEIARVFDTIAQDLSHGYLLQFRPVAVEGHAWRPISVTVAGPKRTVRTREGYYPE